jgi:hypothetical protein
MERPMRLALLALALILSGCALTRTVSERDVSHVLGRTVIVQYADADGWETRNSDTLYVYLERGWQPEPCYYRVGAIATLAAHAADRDPNDVLDAIDIPRRFGYTPGDSKVDATRQQARLETSQKPRWTFQNQAPGWPTEYYRGR